MKRKELVIPEPCSADWEQMHGDDRKRFCDLCTKNVHNLSDMTESDARELLETKDNLCIQYAFDRGGEVLFADSPAPHWRLHRQIQGAKRLLAAAAIALPMFACEPAEQAASPTANPPVSEESPIKIGDTVSISGTKPGAGVKPTFVPSTEPDDHAIEMGKVAAPEPNHQMVKGKKKAPDEEIVEMMGDVAYEPEKEMGEAQVVVTKGDAAYEPEKDGEASEGGGCDGGAEKHDDASTSATKQPELDPVKVVRGRMAAPGSDTD